MSAVPPVLGRFTCSAYTKYENKFIDVKATAIGEFVASQAANPQQRDAVERALAEVFPELEVGKSQVLREEIIDAVFRKAYGHHNKK